MCRSHMLVICTVLLLVAWLVPGLCDCISAGSKCCLGTEGNSCGGPAAVGVSSVGLVLYTLH